MNRPKYFKMARVSAEMTWEWHSRRYSQHKLTPFKLTYSNLLSTTAAFDSAYFHNRAIAQSFDDVFIPQMSYTYTLDRTFGKNNFVWSTTVTEAGNLCYLIWRACGVEKGNMHILNTYFSQFIKAHTQLVWTRALFGEHQLVTRVFLGAAHAYGNYEEVPYMEQFYIGGSNSLRGFAVRTVGPGSYRPQVLDRNSYYDQTGTFKFEANVEYRFGIVWKLEGALFADAGNVWSLYKDASEEERFSWDSIAADWGVGIRLNMDFLVVRVDFGMQVHDPATLNVSRGWVGPKDWFKKGNCAVHFGVGYPF